MSDYFKLAASLKQPTSKTFDADAWTKLLDKIDEPTVEERSHNATALEFGQQLKMLRDKRDKFLVKRARPADGVTIVCGILNYTNIQIKALLQRGYEHATGPINSPIQFFNNPMVIDGIELPSVDAMNERLIDAGARWLYDAVHLSGTEVADNYLMPFNRWNSESQLYIVEVQIRMFANLFEHAGWRIVGTENGRLFAPLDEHGEMFAVAVRLRQESINTAFAQEVMVHCRRIRDAGIHPDSNKMHKTLLAICGSERRRWRVVDGSLESEHILRGIAHEAVMENSYAAPLLDEDMPCFPGVTVRIVLRSWAILAAMAAVEECPNENSTIDLSVARRHSCRLSRKRLCNLLIKTLRISAAQAEQLVQLLTLRLDVKYSFEDRGLWSAPIVEVPGTNDVCVVVGSPRSGNPQWIIDAWLAKGGLLNDKGGRTKGGLVEQRIRETLVAAIDGNRLLTTSHCYPYAVKKKHYGEEIDVLIKLGGTLLVIEIKTVASPDEAWSRKIYDKKQRKACNQASTKANCVFRHPEITANLFGISKAEAAALKVLPIAAFNHGPGRIALEEKEVVLTDTHFLRVFLEAGHFESGIAVELKAGRVAKRSERLYWTEEEAENVIVETLRNPSILLKMIERLNCTTYRWPAEPASKVFDVRFYEVNESSEGANIAASLLKPSS